MSEYQIAGGIPITWLLSVSGVVLGGVFGLFKWFAGRMIDEIETRLKRIDDLETRFERLMTELPLHYQRREDAIREYTTINAKIDRLTEVLIDIRGVMNAKQN
jgi:HAMP domain-containing protein